MCDVSSGLIASTVLPSIVSVPPIVPWTWESSGLRRPRVAVVLVDGDVDDRVGGHGEDRAVDPLAVLADQVGDPVWVRRAVLGTDRSDCLQCQVGAAAGGGCDGGDDRRRSAGCPGGHVETESTPSQLRRRLRPRASWRTGSRITPAVRVTSPEAVACLPKASLPSPQALALLRPNVLTLTSGWLAVQVYKRTLMKVFPVFGVPASGP